MCFFFLWHVCSETPPKSILTAVHGAIHLVFEAQTLLPLLGHWQLQIVQRDFLLSLQSPVGFKGPWHSEGIVR